MSGLNPSTSGAAETAIRREPRAYGEVQAGDTFIWCGRRLRVERGGIALGMPIRELTLHVSEWEIEDE